MRVHFMRLLSLVTLLGVGSCGSDPAGSAGDVGIAVDLSHSSDPSVGFITPDAAADIDPGPAAECDGDEDCATDNACVIAVCGVGGRCSEKPVPGKACDDGDACTTGESCDDTGGCTGGQGIAGEGGPCVLCTCDPVTGPTCAPAAAGVDCDDDDCCTESDRCVVCEAGDVDCADGRACRGVAKSCTDGVACTVDDCDCSDAIASCTHTPLADGAACEADANLCTNGDSCLSGACVAGPSASLDDGDPCTQDICVKGDIVHQPLLEGQCDDGNECTTADHCLLGSCVGGPPVTCDVPTCAGSASCVSGQGCVTVWLPAGAVCAGESLCAAAFACDLTHACVSTGSKACDDGDACTTDSCLPGSGECAHTPTLLDCTGADECHVAACNPKTGLCDATLENGTPCSSGFCSDGVCVCEPDCSTADCGEDGCGGTCGTCGDGLTCSDGACVGCAASCTTVCLPDGSCCPPDGFCPTANTDIAGAHSYSLIYIPTGVTVTCTGTQRLELTVSGRVLIEGTLRADGPNGSTVSESADTDGVCGGQNGGDGFRDCTYSSTTFCETTTASAAQCAALISPKESYSGPPCAYVSSAPGQPGSGTGGGFGGQMAHPLHNAAPGVSAGGGGGSYVTSGVAGAPGNTNCPATLAGGAPGPTMAVVPEAPVGGSGGGAGGMARNGACGNACPGGCTGWGGDGGAGGGVIVLQAGGPVEVPGLLSARGGSGATGGGAVCLGSGGGGSGGAIRIVAPSLVTPGAVADHVDVRGGSGGTPQCAGLGAGGSGGSGVLLAP